MQPREIYLNAIASGNLKNDPAQNDAITELQRCYLELKKKPSRLLPRKFVKGVYLWGNVGVGKSMLINILYRTLGDDIAYRGHYHQWMLSIQNELNKLSGKKNPIKICAKQWAKRYRVLILDEFLVTNIADAMIMANWLKELRSNKVTLVTTSNTEPQNLYRNGIGREKFLPAIDLIEENNTVLNLNGEQDYRTLSKTITNSYISPCDVNSESYLHAAFNTASNGINLDQQDIQINGRTIKIIAHSITTLWINFIDLCNIPRSQLDYIEIAQKYKTIIIDHLPKINATQHNLAENLIKAIDIFYDADINLIVAADCLPNEIYPNGRHAKAFLRTASRLSSLGRKQINNANET